MGQTEWFGTWFDSPFYHVLYKHRDYDEARAFIRVLVEQLGIASGQKILDVACGKGRHAIQLNNMGFEVEGIDLSAQNIEHAKAFENDKLHFARHDMREVYKEEAFDVVLNLFTSFGYFDTHVEHEQAIKAMAAALKPGGSFVLDFLNPYVVINELVQEEVKIIDNIEFHINKSYDGEFILKKINFKDGGKEYEYLEKVKAIRRIEFLEYFRNAGLKLINTYGDYHMAPYEPEQSDRLIFWLKK